MPWKLKLYVAAALLCESLVTVYMYMCMYGVHGTHVCVVNEFQKPTIAAKVFTAYLALFQFVVYYKKNSKAVCEATVEQTKILFSRIHVASIF